MTVSFRTPIVSMGLFLAASYVTSRPALGDVLTFHNGDSISGAVTRDRDTYQIRTDNGRSQTFDRSKVKKWKKYSRTELGEARELFNELVELARPALTKEPPDQRVWAESVRTDTNSYAYTMSGGRIGSAGASISWSAGDGRGRSEQRLTTERQTGIDKVFIGEWGRYIIEFEVLAALPRYTQLTDPNRDRNPLYDFHRYPIEVQKAIAKPVGDAIRALQQCVKAARDSQAKISRFPAQWANLDRDVRRASDAASDAYRKMSGAHDSHGARHAYNRKERTLDKKITNMIDHVERIANAADLTMADLYAARKIVLAQLEAAAEILGHADDEQLQPDVPPTTPPAGKDVQQISDVLPASDRLIGTDGVACRKQPGLDATKAGSAATVIERLG
ncbi:MAG: hypothetical protein IID59_00700 [Proteobacteria bacterium]|nr:hypothetical protein [Pseudomonadota bacterium]